MRQLDLAVAVEGGVAVRFLAAWITGEIAREDLILILLNY